MGLNIIKLIICAGNNVLLTSAKRAKLTDFGLSKITTIMLTQEPSGIKGTYHFMAPEVVCGKSSKKSDTV